MPETKKEQGFTLLEMTVSLSILALMAAVSAPTISRWVDNTRVSETEEELEYLSQSCIRYYRDTGVFPPVLTSLVANTPARSGWAGPYHSCNPNLGANETDDMAKDAWGNDYILATIDAFTRRLTSKGRDGVVGGGKYSDDIVIRFNSNEVSRETTDRELVVINSAVERYNKLLLATEGALSTNYTTMLATLKSYGLLINSNEYTTDGWGQSYVCGSSPVQEVKSSGTPSN